ncbi:hypothetical protein CN206_13925 [Sinorhizobium meliloti]|nr:hypothetical protein CN206_13925 [Sinorhizobium meliloti]
MRRREVLILSSVVLAATSVPAAQAQQGSFRPTKRQIAEALNEPAKFSEVLVAVDALRLNLLLTKSSLGEALTASMEQLPEYRRLKEAAVLGAEKLRGTLDSSPEPMEELGTALQAPVDKAISILVEHGLQPGSELLERQVQGFWTFLYALTESGQETAENIGQWICGSNPFDALCG